MTPFFPSLHSTFNLGRSMFTVLFLLLLLLIATPSLPAQTTANDQSSEIVIAPEGDKFLRWYGHTGRSYFVQIADPNNPLAKWLWAPVIEAGNDEEISHEVDGTASKSFFRLKYTDQVPGPNETLETADFDGDGISNWDEINAYSTDPLNNDTDGDGLDDDYEVWYFDTDPNNIDTDGDGLSDGDEVFVYWTNPSNSDSDNDGLSDGAEFNLHGTDPNIADSDGDGMPDGLEIAHLLDPLDPADGTGDLDSDGMPNAWEFTNGLDIAINDSTGDLDSDELDNLPEYQIGTKANLFDSDGDLLPDGWEVRYGLNPMSDVGANGMNGDVTPDLVTNIDELIHGASPILADTDGDGASDRQEIDQGSDPANASDGGQPPAPEDIAFVKLTVGDPSGSESERYNMIVKGLEGDTRTITHQAKEFGVVSTAPYKLRKGAKYEVEIVHTGTRPDFLEENGFSNYDWKADIQPGGLGVILKPAVLLKKDPHTILTEFIDWPNSTFRIKGKKAELFVMKFETKTVAILPLDRKRKRIGVAEMVNITVTPEGAGAITWTMENQQDSDLKKDENYKPRLIAASVSCNPVVKADFGNEITHTIDFEVAEPSGEFVVIKDHELTIAEMGITAQQQGVGMELDIKVMPDDVSFANLEVKELPGPATNKVGYFSVTPADLEHQPNLNWHRLSLSNKYPDFAGLSNMPKIMHQNVLQWIPGSCEWSIPLRWRVPEKSERDFPNIIQTFELTGNDGTSEVKKFEKSATRTPTP